MAKTLCQNPKCHSERSEVPHPTPPASALAWPRHNIKNPPAESLDKTVNLEAPELDIPAAAVAVTITAPAGKNPQAQITTSATRKRRTLKSQNEYNLAQ